MALRKIKTLDDEVLRKRSKPVTRFDKKLEELIEDMKETMYNANGVGLAAPQVGILRKVIVVDIGEGPIALINPSVEYSEGVQIDIEGCLSVPNVWGEVERPEKIIVNAKDKDSNPIRIEAEGFLARVLCHEIDHLDGILFVDKVIRYVTQEELEKRRSKGDKIDVE